MSFDKMKASDPRDKIYGLLGLVEHAAANSEDAFITVDYAKSKHEVFVDVMEAVMATHPAGTKGLDIFSTGLVKELEIKGLNDDIMHIVRRVGIQNRQSPPDE
jgi:hypothetical protein